MTTSRDLLNVGLAGQAANLALHPFKKGKKKRKLISTGVETLVGTSLFKAQADITGSIV